MPPGSNGLKRDEETNSSDGISPNSAQEKITSSQQYIQRPKAATTLSRGEAQGGHYSPTTTHESHKGDCFILYGGMHRHRTSDVLENGGNAPSFSNEVPLGNVWKYDYETEMLNLLAPYPQLDWQLDTTNIKPFPMVQTTHAGTIVGDKLIIHGGMDSYGDERHDNNDNMADPLTTSSFSSSNLYARHRTSPK